MTTRTINRYKGTGYPEGGHYAFDEITVRKIIDKLDAAYIRRYGTGLGDDRPRSKAPEGKRQPRNIWASIAETLKANPELTNHQLALMSGAGSSTIEKARNRAGIPTKRGIGEKRQRVLDAMAKNPDASRKQIATIVGGDCTPEFVGYVHRLQLKAEGK